MPKRLTSREEDERDAKKVKARVEVIHKKVVDVRDSLSEILTKQEDFELLVIQKRLEKMLGK